MAAQGSKGFWQERLNALRWAWQHWVQRGGRPVLGLALSGGGARGVAHIGALAALEEAGIRPDLVAGTSAGSLVGAFYCAGWDSAGMLQEVKNFSWREIARLRLPDPRGLVDSRLIEEGISRRLGDLRIEELAIPYAAVATDLLTGERVVLQEGPVAPAVRASCAIPGIFSPYVAPDGRMLVDGGVVDNLPVQVARQMGAEVVLAVNVSSTTTPLDKPPRNVIEVLEYSWRMERAEEVFQAGYQAAQEVIPQVLQVWKPRVPLPVGGPDTTG